MSTSVLFQGFYRILLHVTQDGAAFTSVGL